MSVKNILTLLIILGLTTSACGQQKTTPATRTVTVRKSTKANPFQQVAVPDSILKRINQTIKHQEKLSEDTFPLYIFNLENHDNHIFQEGIYSYKLSSPHAKRRFFIVYKDATTIFEGVFVNDVLREYLRFVEKKRLPASITIRYLKVISKLLDSEYSATL